MSHADRAEALAMQGRIADAYALLETAIADGDGMAAATLADWRMACALIRRDLGEARRLYGLAAQLGMPMQHRYTSPCSPMARADRGGTGARHWPRCAPAIAQRQH